MRRFFVKWILISAVFLCFVFVFGYLFRVFFFPSFSLVRETRGAIFVDNLDGYDEWAEKNVKNDYYEGRGRMHRQYFSNLYSFCKHKKIAWFSKVNQRRQQVKLDKAKAEEEGTNK